MHPSHQVIIIGGGVIGSSVAYHLAANSDFDGRILVVEKDPSYQYCASARSVASIRQQYSSAINIDISLFGIEFLRHIGDLLEVDGQRPDIALREAGYLFLASPGGRAVLARNHALQTERGADILWLEPDALAQRFPWLEVADLAAGCWGHTGEGWFDGYGLLQAFRRKARALGVEYLAREVTAVERHGERISAVRLDDGSRLSCAAAVNAAGFSGTAIARMAGLDVPVHNRKRMVFSFDCREPLPGCPLLIDPRGVYVRPEGRGFICGSAPPPEADPDSDDFEVDHDFFLDYIWPILAARIPTFERIKPGRAWACHYDLNLFDHNALVGAAPGVSNFYLANGFSGHGLQQAPAIGRGLSELITYGRYTSLDLEPLSVARLSANRPLAENNVV